MMKKSLLTISSVVLIASGMPLTAHAENGAMTSEETAITIYLEEQPLRLRAKTTRYFFKNYPPQKYKGKIRQSVVKTSGGYYGYYI